MRGGNGEVEAVDGDADGDAHAREAQVALAQDGGQCLVGGLRGAQGTGKVGPRWGSSWGRPRDGHDSLPPGGHGPLTHLLLPGAPDARHGLMEPVDGFPVWAEEGGGLESLEWREQRLREGGVRGRWAEEGVQWILSGEGLRGGRNAGAPGSLAQGLRAPSRPPRVPRRCSCPQLSPSSSFFLSDQRTSEPQPT